MKELRRLYRTIRLGALLLGLPLVVASVGCGDLNRTSLASTSVETEEVMSQPAGYLVFTQRAALRAAKRVKVDNSAGVFTHTESDYFRSDENGTLEIDFAKYGDKETIRIDKVRFKVKKNSIDLSDLAPEELDEFVRERRSSFKCRIEMSASTGTTLEDVVVAFNPEGLIFDPVATLEIKLKGDVGDGVLTEGESVAYHIDSRGRVSKVAMHVNVERGGGHVLKIDVPGFSRYGLDD